MAPLLARRLPVDALLVRRIDAGRSCVETVAATASGGEEASGGARSDLDAAELEALLAWCSDGRVLHRRAPALAERLPGALPRDVEGDVLLGPLLDGETPIGLLALVARKPHAFAAEHVDVAAALLEPFGVGPRQRPPSAGGRVAARGGGGGQAARCSRVSAARTSRRRSSAPRVASVR